MLGSIPADDLTVVADLEAGIGTLTRLPPAAVDVVLVVVEPTPRSVDVARRALAVATEQQQGRIVVVANKVTGDDDRLMIETALGDHEIVVVPADPAVEIADRAGASPVDTAPTDPAVRALETLADLLRSAPLGQAEPERCPPNPGDPDRHRRRTTSIPAP